MIANAIKSLVRRAVGALGYRIERVSGSAAFSWRSTHRLSANEDPILQVAKAHLEQSSMPVDLPSLGRRWGAYASQLRSRIKRISSSEELILFGQSPEAGVETHFPRHELLGFCHQSDLQLLADDLPPQLIDALPSFRSPQTIRPDHVIDYNGRKIDRVSQRSAVHILTLLDLLKGAWPQSVCDIGGGTGTYARSWLTNSAHRPDLVVIVDIPETLIYSETLLRSELQDIEIQYISSPGSIPSKLGIILCPIANIRALENISFDLAMNVGSMQEMTDEWVDWYMEWLDRQPCRYFFSNNYFANALTNLREGHNSWSPRPNSSWQLIDSRIPYGARISARMLFRNDGDDTSLQNARCGKGAEAWLGCLETARRRPDESSLRGALDFARSEMPFVPKEAWQVAKTLCEITKLADDREVFEDLDRMRKTGNEAAH